MSKVDDQMLHTSLESGQIIELSKNILRVVADNGNAMTGPGTNTYILGNGHLAVIDPGPVSSGHLDAILKAASTRGEIKYILLTHTHSDHSPGCVALQEKTGAKLALYPYPSGKPFSDIPVPADIPLSHNDFLPDFNVDVQAVHTPGHASNHLCFYLPEEKAFFTGDHLMNGSTVVIGSPDGNMSEYLDSLALLKTYDIAYLCPGHGLVMEEMEKIVDHTIAHRLKREGKVLSAVKQGGTSSIDQVLKIAYEDTPAFLHGLAKMSLLAHLEKLARDGKVIANNNDWSCLE